MPNISQRMLPEFDQEMATTRKVLEQVPSNKFGWTPHERSMTLGRLACHVASAPFFATQCSKSDVCDFEKGDYKEIEVSNTEQLVSEFDKWAADSRAALASMSDEELMKTWVMKAGDHVVATIPKVGVVRTVMMNHMIHHRGQLAVYLRLVGVKVPSIYGPSADEPGFMG